MWCIQLAFAAVAVVAGGADSQCIGSADAHCAQGVDYADTSLLQSKASERLAAGEGKRTTDGSHFVQLDGKTKTAVPRKDTNGFVREVLISWPIDSNPFKFNPDKTQALFPFQKVLEGRYSRSSPTTSQEDYGIEKSVIFQGEKSMISPLVKLGFTEKSHTLWYPTDVPAHTEETLRREMDSQTMAQKQEAEKGRRDRNLGLTANGALLGVQILNAGKDDQHMSAVRNYAAQGMTREIGTSYNQANAKLQQRRALGKSEIVRSSIGCIHFENAEDMQFFSDGISVPLDKMMTAYRGRLASGPNAEYQMSAGIGVFHVNNQTNSLDLYLAFSDVVEVIDTASGLQAQFAVGPIDGASVRGPGEGRKPSDSLNIIASMGAQMAALVPPDFNFMHRPRQEVGCSDEVLRQMVGQGDKLQKIFQMDMSTMMSAMLSPMDFIDDTYGAVQDQISCAVEYLRPVNPNLPARFGVFESFGLLHVLMEMPGPVMALTFFRSDLWNTISLT